MVLGGEPLTSMMMVVGSTSFSYVLLRLKVYLADTTAAPLHTILCICLYLAVAFIYTATVFGVIRTKWLLVPLFGLPLIVHIYLDRDMIAPKGKTVVLAELLPEISVLCIMAALLCICFAMKRRDFAAEKASSAEQQTIDLLVSNEEPPASEIMPDAAPQEGDAHE